LAQVIAPAINISNKKNSIAIIAGAINNKFTAGVIIGCSFLFFKKITFFKFFKKI